MHVFLYAEATTLGENLQGAIWVWVGFVAPVMLGKVLWEGKSWKLFGIESGYYLVALVLVSVIYSILL